MTVCKSSLKNSSLLSWVLFDGYYNKNTDFEKTKNDILTENCFPNEICKGRGK